MPYAQLAAVQPAALKVDLKKGKSITGLFLDAYYWRHDRARQGGQSTKFDVVGFPSEVLVSLVSMIVSIVPWMENQETNEAQRGSTTSGESLAATSDPHWFRKRHWLRHGLAGFWCLQNVVHCWDSSDHWQRLELLGRSRFDQAGRKSMFLLHGPAQCNHCNYSMSVCILHKYFA